jgi:outer membrane protein OmpA-like peptidoglycan-associated protein
MRTLRLLGVVGLCALAMPPLAAQEAGTWDISLFFRYSQLADNIAENPAIGGGGRIGAFILRNIAIEFDQSMTSSSDPKQGYYPVNVRLALHRPWTANWTGIIGAGFVRDQTDPPGPVDRVDHSGASALLGIQRKLGARTSLRLDGIAEYLPSTTIGALGDGENSVNFHVQFGLVWRWEKPLPPPDSDGDGVPDASDRCAGTRTGAYVNYFGCVPEPDTDGDGILDSADRCANTPAGTAIDANGCPRDSDGDGVLDAADRCANSPAGQAVDATGCPRDSDRDGVLDAADRCANTPVGTTVDANGCAIPVDSDRDGVMDNVDACANTPVGTRVDARGCAVVFEAGRTTIVLEGVTFASGSAVLTPASQAVLDRVAVQLVGAPEVNVEVQGHTDNTGSVNGNIRISQLRADAVRDYLISKGVAAGRLTARGYGPTEPAVPNTTAANRAQNRRVELKRTN